MSFECKQCGNCCRTMPPKYWRNSPLFLNPPNPKDKKPEPDISDLEINSVGCELLTNDNLCGLEVKFGKEAKPEACRNFPANDEQRKSCLKLRETN